ncbi:S-layer homology domain-containing protein [Sporosarcina cyprini]|uniref:S-layer homology domain-containing protein n=1 Tax=Sporosarcina cyprini TaxID=2910523 RepID=UPI001EE13829|nr:S-layer homology domain-containing protein [Sporosarcina cyprini]MCG3088290.1 S-layer homology domain-containing protein [Sporosarcina cyprini]
MANQPTKYRKFVVGAASAALVASAVAPVASAKTFSDTKGNTHEAAIDALSDAGVITGYEDGSFKPNKTLTRSDVVKLMGKWLVSEGYEVPGDYKTNMRFSDLTASSNDELLKYAAVVKDNGVFNGSNGRLLAGDDITRENMAVVLVRAFDTVNDINLVEYVEGQDFKKEVTDRNSAKSEARTAIDVLDFFDITTVAQFNPKATTTRGHFATFLHNFLKADLSKVTGTVAGVASITAINNTHVEVKFVEKVEDLAALNFKIEGLDITNKVIKQTDANTVVLTTAPQKAGETYKVSANDKELGSFIGATAVIPTSIQITTPSLQGTIGKDVTVQAKVEVAAGEKKDGIPVTFNIANGANNQLNEKIEVVAYTNAEGVASYTYTRYYAIDDNVTAYATQKSDKSSVGKVYWANAKQLTITEASEGNTLVNGAKKVYEINAPGKAGQYVFVAFEENLNVTPDKAEGKATVEGVTTYVVDKNGNVLLGNASYPYQYTTGGTAVTAVKLDSNGKANLVVSGKNATVTPIVYSGEYGFATNTTNLNKVPLYSKTALQDKGATVKFELKHELGLKLEAAGSSNAAIWLNDVETGGRNYTATYTDKDGKVASPGTTVRVALPNTTPSVFVLDKDGNEAAYTSDAKYKYYDLKVGKDGQVTFTVASKSVNAYVSPVVFIENGDAAGLDANDLQATGEITYFVNEVTYNADLDDGFGGTIPYLAGEVATATYTLVDQNYKPRSYTQDTVVSFEIKAGTGNVTVNTSAGTKTILAGTTGTVKETITAGNVDTSIRVSAADPSSVSINATGSRAGVVLPTTETLNLKFSQYGSAPITGTVSSIDTTNKVLTINGVVYSYATAKEYQIAGSKVTQAAFVKEITAGVSKVSVTVDAEGKLTFNVLTSGYSNVVSAVNSATTLNQVKAALAGYPSYEKLTDADKDTMAAAILSDLQGGTTFTAASLENKVAAAIKITATATYAAGSAAVTGAKATGVYTNATTPANTLTVESAAGDTAYNGVKVVFEKATTVGNTVTTSYDGTSKTLKVILPVSDAVNGTLDAAATIANVATAITNDTSTSLTATAAGFAGTESASELLGKTITLSGATASTPAVDGTLTLTFSEAITAFTGIVLNDGATTAINNSQAVLSDDGKKVVITLTTAQEAVVAAPTTTAITTVTVTPEVTGQTVTVPVTIKK